MSDVARNTGGYEDGYRSCPCFWGRRPGRFVVRLCEHVTDWAGARVLDAGCGEGKNAIFLARLGAQVLAVDVCAAALNNAKQAWADSSLVEWQQMDIRAMPLANTAFAVVVAYGLLHCLPSKADVQETLRRLQNATLPGGYHVLCALNDRRQELTAHPGFAPILLEHSLYLGYYRDWDVLQVTDDDLHEVHPHNEIPHVHSLTRILARKRAIS